LLGGARELHAAQARSLPPDVIKKSKAPRLDFREESISFTTARGKTLTANLLIPSSLPVSGKLPLLIVFGGTLSPPDEPMLLASFEYPFPSFDDFEVAKSFNFAVRCKESVQDAVSGILELYNVLRKRPEVDSTRITLVGESLSAP